MVEWNPPGPDGLQDCPAHPELGRWKPSRGCTSCRAAPAEADDAEPLTPEADRILVDLAAIEADERGVPDMLALEKFVDKARKVARAETAHNQRRAEVYEKRADDIAEGRIVVTQTDREGGTVDANQDRAAAAWAGEAAKARMAVQKGIDVQAKLLKLNMTPAAARYRAKQLKYRAQLGAGGKRGAAS